jgi:hypothetical protein
MQVFIAPQYCTKSYKNLNIQQIQRSVGPTGIVFIRMWQSADYVILRGRIEDVLFLSSVSKMVASRRELQLCREFFLKLSGPEPGTNLLS